jgi:hypothetical protein
MTMASRAEATVQVTDNNWKILIGSQNIQIEMLTRILNKLDTLTTSDELTDYMERQIQILQQHAEDTVLTMEEYQKKMMHSADSLEKECQWAAKNLEKQAGSVSEQFSKSLSDQTTLMKKLTKRCFRIALIPSLILLLLELVPRIWQLIFGS